MADFTNAGLERLADADPVAMVAATLRQHANSFDMGFDSVTITGAQFASKTITFNEVFDAPPAVVAIAYGPNASLFYAYAVGAPTIANAAVGVRHRDASNVSYTISFMWIAIGKGKKLGG